MFNSMGNVLRLTTFGESHGVAIGGILDGFPAGISLDLELVQNQLDRRKPGQSTIVTQRKESDMVEFLSGIFEGVSTGQPIAFIIKNENQRSGDYSEMKETFRPSHADYTYTQKYGIRDYRGGGRSSARETANWVVAGALASQIIPEIEVRSYVSAVGNIALQKPFSELDFSVENIVRCPDHDTAQKMIEFISQIKKQGDTVGGIISTHVQNIPQGLGEPIFHKLQSELAKAMLTINACKGFEYGSGFAGTQMKGSEHNDLFNEDGTTQSNNSGGIQGGISNGMPITFRLAFKPVATVLQEYETLNSKGEITSLQGRGRHDPCVVPRAVPIVEALTHFALADMYLLNKTRKL